MNSNEYWDDDESFYIETGRSTESRGSRDDADGRGYDRRGAESSGYRRRDRRSTEEGEYIRRSRRSAEESGYSRSDRRGGRGAEKLRQQESRGSRRTSGRGGTRPDTRSGGMQDPPFDDEEAGYRYDYDARHEQWLEDEGALRRRRRREKREAELRRKKRIALLTVAAVLAVLIAVLIVRNVSRTGGSGSGTEETVQEVSEAEESAQALTMDDNEEISGELLSVEAQETAEAEEVTELLYSYVETDSTIDLGESLTDISIYDAQRHITSSSSGSDETYGDDGNEDDSSAEDTAAAAAADDYIDSQYAILVNIDTGEILAERNAFDQIIPASMTKVMTLLVAVEALDNYDEQLQDTFTMTQEICDESYLSGSSFVGYGVGDVATVEDMLYGTILPSGADAAMGLAEYTAGSQEAFVALMNEKVEELGLSETTHFSNVIGLYDDGANYSTPYDMCVIMNAAIENELCRQILSQRSWTTQAIMDNPDGTTISNWFLRRAEDHIEDWSILCGKTGYVNESGNCAVSYYQSSITGTNYIACTALTYSSWRCIYDHTAIYNTYAE